MQSHHVVWCGRSTLSTLSTNAMRLEQQVTPAPSQRSVASATKLGYGQVEDTIVTVSTLSFGAFAFEDADVALVDVELPDAGSTVPAIVTL